MGVCTEAMVNMDVAETSSSAASAPATLPKPAKSDASRMLEAALQQMDGIISGRCHVTYYLLLKYI